jgi:hypothetical protein
VRYGIALCRVSKLKCTLVQALRLCTSRTVRRSRSIALLFLDHGTRRGEGSASHPAALCPQERPGTHCTGGWMGPRTGLVSPPPGFDPRTVQPDYATRPVLCRVTCMITSVYIALDAGG